MYLKKYPIKLSDDPHLRFKQVQITETSFSTYRAALVYLRTGSIKFAPLSSRCKSLSTTNRLWQAYLQPACGRLSRICKFGKVSSQPAAMALSCAHY